ncbi:hypothetical protein E2C01_082933 [Portunus trituberculatus]|uniref:Uncharacterized protein n=1 Tax=Portunus trituberculatus TaxID=210409 RepID=A0A5B7J0L2_PORTR|nr:hypothetical protein [Portunus trituberculatus]
MGSTHRHNTLAALPILTTSEDLMHNTTHQKKYVLGNTQPRQNTIYFSISTFSSHKEEEEEEEEKIKKKKKEKEKNKKNRNKRNKNKKKTKNKKKREKKGGKDEDKEFNKK